MLTIEQQQAREHGIGASECAAVLGISPYCTPYELWLVKTGRMPKEDILTESRVRLRNFHEETIAREYAIQKNVKLKRVHKTLYHKKFPFMLCHLDRVVIGQRKIVECKSSMGWMKSTWGEVGTDNVPMDYLAQVQHQYACSNLTEADMAVLIDIDDFRIYPIERDNDVIKTIEERVEHFWRYHVEEDNAPEPTTRGDIKLLFPSNNGKFIEATPETTQLINEINARKGLIKATETEQDELEVKLLNIIGENDGIKDDKETLVTYLADKNGKRTLRIKKRS